MKYGFNKGFNCNSQHPAMTAIHVKKTCDCVIVTRKIPLGNIVSKHLIATSNIVFNSL